MKICGCRIVYIHFSLPNYITKSSTTWILSYYSAVIPTLQSRNPIKCLDPGTYTLHIQEFISGCGVHCKSRLFPSSHNRLFIQKMKTILSTRLVSIKQTLLICSHRQYTQLRIGFNPSDYFRSHLLVCCHLLSFKIPCHGIYQLLIQCLFQFPSWGQVVECRQDLQGKFFENTKGKVDHLVIGMRVETTGLMCLE